MALDQNLLNILMCPSCRNSSFLESAESLICSSCKIQYPIISGIPDMRIFSSDSSSSDFNETQARYEADIHDKEAESGYEQHVIQTYGTKTKMIVQDWAKELEGIPDPVVLDYGCGTGQVSRVMKKYVSPLFAFDISAISVRKNVHDNNVIGVLANAFYLPFRDKVFDIVCINGVLHHIVDLDLAINEITRVTKGMVNISELLPHRKVMSMSTVELYPGIMKKIFYLFYILYFMTSLPRRIINKLYRIISTRKENDKIEMDFGSKYERPLTLNEIEERFATHGFARNRLRYFTNIMVRGDSWIKNYLTTALINGKTGTHLDLSLKRGAK